MGKIPWETYDDIPKRNLYNADECATNTYNHRKRTIGDAKEFGRAFQITPGGDGRLPFHITSMITSCASGNYKVPIEGIDGAPPPMIIHACIASPNKEDPTDLQIFSEKFYQNPSFSEGITEPFSVSANDEAKNNPWGFMVRTSAAGSMMQRTFYDYCIHFIARIPKNQGKNGEPVILFLDGHSSRWDVSSLLFLLDNNVFPFILPSHTSIWTQPNDNGVNLRWLKCIEKSVSSLWMRWNGISTSPGYFNIILRQGWKIFLKAERDDLLCCDSNNTTSSWAKTGLFPSNPFCETWEAIIENIGPLKRHYKKVRGGEKTAEYEIKLLENSVPLSEGEKKTLKNGCVQDDYVQAAYFHMRSVLSSWKRRLIFEKHVKLEPQSAP